MDATPDQLIDNYAQGLMGKDTLVDSLNRDDFAPSTKMEGWDDLYVPAKGSIADVIVNAYRSGKIDADLYDQIRLKFLAQKDAS